MREFSTQITQALANGLKPDETFRDTMFLDDLYNLVPSEIGLASYESLTDVMPFPQEERVEYYYPFPQWFRFDNDNFVVTKDSLFAVEEFPQPPFELESVLIETPEFSESFRGVDLGGNWILTNREGTLYKYNGDIQFSDELRASALVKHKNRTLIGGALDGLWTDQFLFELDKVVGLSNLEDSEFDLELSKNYVFWSDFDSALFPMSLLHPDIMFNDFTQDNPFTDLLYSNEFGYIESPYRGDVLDMIVSNDQVFVFQEDGLFSMAPVTDATGATYGITGKQPFGIKKRGAVGGDGSSFVFIDVFNQLWLVNSQGLQKLDYSEYMSQLTGEIWITKDPEEELFYIGDSETSFLLAGNRLARIYQTVHSASGAFPFRGGVITETGSDEAILRSDNIDIGNTDNKTLTGVAVGTDSEVRGVARAFGQVNGKKVTGPPVSLNLEGYAATRMYASQHGIEIIFNRYQELNVDHIELKWQIDDKRQRRGAFATQDSTGAG